jgi:hypothetical protein
MQALIKFLGNRAFISRAKEMGGYDTSDAGRVRAAP